MKHSKARRVKSKRRSGGRFSPVSLARQLLKQRAEEKRARFIKETIARARNARDRFKPRKVDRGKLLFIGTDGGRSPTKKGRKGYPVYVTKTGKKYLIKQHGKEPFKARTMSELVLPERRNLRRASREFQQRRLVKVGRIRTIARKTGAVASGGAHDFSNTVSDKIAASVRSALGAQASHRIFLIHFVALVRLPDGSTEAIHGQVPIERPDHINIRLAGIRNFVRQKFYSFMARELAFAGYVSNGSANHIRRLADNEGAEREDWVDKRGESWGGRDKEQVEIIKIEWKIEQAT